MTETSGWKHFRVRPRLDPKPWGGTRLAALGFERPATADEPLGEVLITANQSVIASGPHRGTTLGDLTDRFPNEIAGRLGRIASTPQGGFPLLIKLIDAAQNLSIQVHPDDDQAAAANSRGKTEAWYLLDADAGSQLYLGLDGSTLPAFLADCEAGDGSSARHLRRVAGRPGSSVVLPAGTIHALGAGLLVYEVQQPSEITYRLDDWGRVGADGAPRDRHLAEGSRAIKPYLRPATINGIALPDGDGARLLLAACRYFALDRYTFGDGQRTTLSARASPQVITAIAGEAVVGEGDDALTLGRGDSVVVPAACPGVTVACHGQATVLRAWVPDLPTEIIAPARRHGVSDTALAAIGITTP